MTYKIDEKVNYSSPWAFEENKGQQCKDIKFTLNKGPYMLLFLEEEIIIGIRETNNAEEIIERKTIEKFENPKEALESLRRFKEIKDFNKEENQSKVYFFKMKFNGGSAAVQIAGEDKHLGKKNYLGIGLPKEGITAVEMYSKIIYKNIYEGIDLVFYFKEGKLEYDFIVQPGGKVEEISLTFEGIDELKIDEENNLVIKVNEEEVKLLKPQGYQSIKGINKAIESEFIIEGKIASFKIGAYNKQYPLTIDPVLEYSSFLGGSSYDYISGIAVDDDSNVYVTGRTDSSNFPQTLPPIGPSTLMKEELFISKYDKLGQRVYSTIIKGVIENSPSITVDKEGRIYINGVVPASTGLQLATLSFGEVYGSGVYACRVSSEGDGLEYYVYIGYTNSGVLIGRNNTISVDEENNAYFTGWNNETNWASIIPSVYKNLGEDVGKAPLYVCKISAAGQLAYFTTVSGNEDITAFSLVVDDIGSVYVMGFTEATTFGTIAPTHIGTIGNVNTLVVKLSTGGDAVEYLTLIGGDGSDFGSDIAIDKQRNIYILVRCTSSNYPLVPPGNIIGGGTSAGECSIFVSKLNCIGSALIYSVLIYEELGLLWNDKFAIDVDNSNQAHITGNTFNTNYPVVNPIYGASQLGNDIFVSTLNANGNEFIFSTYIGGSQNDNSTGIVVDKNGDIYVAGYTYSKDFPVIAAQQPVYGGGAGDGFLFKIKHDVDLQDMYELLINENYGLEEIKNEVKNIETQNGEILGELTEILSFMDRCNCCFYTTGPIEDHCPCSKVLIKLKNNDTITRKVTVKIQDLCDGQHCSGKVRTIILSPGAEKDISYNQLPSGFSLEISPASSKIEVEVFEQCGTFERKLELIKVC